MDYEINMKVFWVQTGLVSRHVCKIRTCFETHYGTICEMDDQSLAFVHALYFRSEAEVHLFDSLALHTCCLDNRVVAASRTIDLRQQRFGFVVVAYFLPIYPKLMLEHSEKLLGGF